MRGDCDPAWFLMIGTGSSFDVKSLSPIGVVPRSGFFVGWGYESRPKGKNMKTKAFVLVGLVLSILLCTVNVYGQGSEWPMFQHDPQQTGNSTDTSISVPLTQRWSYAAGSIITSSPTIANGTVYIGTSDGKVHAIDSSDRTIKWIYDSGIGSTMWSAALVQMTRSI